MHSVAADREPEMLLERVYALCPAFRGAAVETVSDGLANHVFLIGGTAIRIARTASGADALARETALLSVLASAGVPVPHSEMLAYDVMRQVRLPGVSLADALMAGPALFDPVTSQAALGSLLRRLHEVSPPRDLPVVTSADARQRWRGLADRMRSKLFPHLQAHQRRWAEQLFGSVMEDEVDWDYAPVLVHGDLAPYHVFVDPQNGDVTGLIDFGEAHIGDPALDIAPMLGWFGGVDGAASLLRAHNASSSLVQRGMFLASAVEFSWALAALETGRSEWITAHLGIPRHALRPRH